MNARKTPHSRSFNTPITLLLIVSMVASMSTLASMKSVNQKIDHMRAEKKVTTKVPVLTRAEKEQQKQKESKRLPKHKQLRQRRIAKATQKNATISAMEYQELKVKKEGLIAQNDKESAAKYLEQMLKLCESSNLIAEHMLELADLYFDMGELQKAELLYTEFTHLYPGNDNIEYAQYKAILCSFYATLDPERDQTKTHNTIALADTFLARGDLFKKYKGEVEKIRTQCYQKIIDSECNIFSFYLKRGNIKSAQHRLDNLKADWPDKLPEIKPRIIAFEQELADKKNELMGNKPVKKENASIEKPLPVAQQKEKRSFTQRF